MEGVIAPSIGKRAGNAETRMLVEKIVAYYEGWATTALLVT